MPKPPINPNKIAVLSGAGISAPSGLATYRDKDGIWTKYSVEDVGTAEAWARNPAAALEFNNLLKAQVASALPNDAHKAIASLESRFEVVVITQNVDDLHERGGSSRVIHLHGELSKARSSVDPSLVYEVGETGIRLGDYCSKGSQLRPDSVWFGEDIHHYDEAAEEIRSAGKVLVIGTSLSVYPAASLVKLARYNAEKALVDLETKRPAYGFRVIRGSAEKVLPWLAERWLKQN